MSETIQIESIMKDFYAISGIRISIYDTEFNEIHSYPKHLSTYCNKMQEFPNAKAMCIESDRTAFKKVKETGQLYVYKCKFGLYEAVVPLYSFGVLSGYLMMGQFCDNEHHSTHSVLAKTKKYISDHETSLSLCDTITKVDSGLISSYINIMSLLAEYLTKTNRAFTYNKELPKMIKDYLNRNYSSKITLDVLAKKFGYCNVTLTTSFKKEFGTTIMQYLSDIRLDKAAEMIQKTLTPFKQIATDCGFSDQNYFSKAFTKRFGCSPSEYKKKNFANISN